MYGKICVFMIALLLTGAARAESPGVLRWDVHGDIEATYAAVHQALEDKRFYVVFEPDIGRNLSGFAGRWGEEYNRSALVAIRSMVFCNAWYANQVSNRDPDMLALCPMHVTLYQRGETTSVVFVRPTHVGQGSSALSLLEELEAAVSEAIRSGIEVAARGSVLPPEGDGGDIGHEGQPDQHQEQEGNGGTKQ
jgi:hypothetical protein